MESNRPERRVSRYGVDLGTVGASREPAKSPWLFIVEHKCILSDVQMLIEISTSGPGLPMADGQKPMPVSVRPFRGA